LPDRAEELGSDSVLVELVDRAVDASRTPS
jgi:hypothetical protein